MPFGRNGKKKPPRKSRRADDGFPSQWSEWEWSPEDGQYLRYRQVSDTGNEEDDYEYEGGEAAETHGAPDPSYTYNSAAVDTSVTQLGQQLAGVSLGPAADPKRRIDYHSVELDKNFEVHKSADFNIGTVFKIVWVEPDGRGLGGTVITARNRTKFGQSGYSTVRRFITIKTQSGHSVCIPILTYGGRGVKKSGIKLDDHCAIYTGRVPKSSEGLCIDAVHMKRRTPGDVLVENSLVNLAKPYTVEHNIKVCFIGDISKKDIDRLLNAFYYIIGAPPSGNQVPRTSNGLSLTPSYALQGSSTYNEASYQGSSTQGEGESLYQGYDESLYKEE